MREITPHQLEIQRLKEKGLSVRQIAENLKLSESTIRAQIKRIQTKIDAGTYKPEPTKFGFENQLPLCAEGFIQQEQG